jgi:hypothetical protein
MKKTCLKLSIIVLSLFTFFFAFPLAKALTLDSIGALNTAGGAYSEWWYTGTNPMLRGTAGANEDVTITIGEDSSKVTADAQGAWSYQTSLSEGDYAITITSGGDSYNFTLHAGQSMPSNMSNVSETNSTSETTTSVPTTGYPQVAGIALSMTLLAAGAYYLIRARKNTKKAYVKSVLDSVR